VTSEFEYLQAALNSLLGKPVELRRRKPPTWDAGGELYKTEIGALVVDIDPYMSLEDAYTSMFI
jgi:hypothetical protein